MPGSTESKVRAGAWAGTSAAGTGTGLTALGSTQATAYAINQDITVFGTVALSTGARLPASGVAGDDVVVANHGANALTLYPPVGASIGTASANAGLSIPAGKTATCYFVSPTLWLVNVSA